MRRFQWAEAAAVCLGVIISGSVGADPGFRARCGSDHMNPGTHVGRNEWAQKCGYVSSASANLNNAENNYATFLEGVAPVDSNARQHPYACKFARGRGLSGGIRSLSE